MAAALGLHGVEFDDPLESGALQEILTAADQPTALRLEALRLAANNGAPIWVDSALQLVQNPADGDALLDASAVSALGAHAMLSTAGQERRGEITGVLSDAIDDPRAEVRDAALWALLPMGHSKAVNTLVVALRAPEEGSMPPQQAIHGLVAARAAVVHADVIRPWLDDLDGATRAEAVSALAADPASRGAIARLLRDNQQPDQVRSAAIHAIRFSGPRAVPQLLDVAADSAASDRVRSEAVATLRILVRSRNARLTNSDLEHIIATLSSLDASDSGRLGAVIAQTVLKAAQRLQ